MMPKRRPPRIDQLVVQEALRASARRCALWGRGLIQGQVDPSDDAFVKKLVELVRHHEARSPTSEPRANSSDVSVRKRIRNVLADITDVLRDRKRRFGGVRLSTGLFYVLSDKLREHGFDFEWSEVRRAILGALEPKMRSELIEDLLKAYKGPDGAARFCVGAMSLDRGAGERLLAELKKNIQARDPTSRELSTREMVDYFLACLSLGPHSSDIVAAIVMAAYENAWLSPDQPPLRDLMQGQVFHEQVRPRPAYGIASDRKTRAARKGTSRLPRRPGRRILIEE